MADIERELLHVGDEEVENRQPLTRSLWQRLIGFLDGLWIATDAPDGATARLVRDAGVTNVTPHNHGYGDAGLGWGALTASGTLQRDYAGAEAELLGRHRIFAGPSMHCDGVLRFAAFQVPVGINEEDFLAGEFYRQTPGIIQFYGDPGTIKATLTVEALQKWFTYDGDVGDVILTVWVISDGDQPRLVWKGSETQEVTNAALVRFAIEDIPVAPQKWNRWLVSAVVTDDTTTATAGSINVHRWWVTPQRNGT